MEDILAKIDLKMKKAYKSLLRKFSKVRTGRANTSVLDDIKVDYYGQKTPVKQLSNVSVPEPRLIVIKPWDKTVLDNIEKAILASNIGVTPQNDGNVIRLPFQPLTEETRKDIVKDLHEYAEDAKISIRNIRREGNDEIKKMENKSDITEDEKRLYLEDIQELTDKWTDKIEEATKIKEKEILEV